MIALPAIDLRDGACVQLVGGDYASERVRIADPVAQAVRFREAGFGALHVVDLDAATGRGDNAAVVASLLAVPGLSIQVGGGVRSLDAARSLVDQGAVRVVVGTRAVREPAFRAEVAHALPGRVILALDVRGREVTTSGWSEGSGLSLASLLADVDGLPLAGILITAVHKEGALEGPDVALYEEATAASRHRIVASGGVTTNDDLRVLARAGAHAAVIGMALYTGSLDPRVVAASHGSSPAPGEGGSAW